MIFSQNASAFNCRFIAFKKLDMGQLPLDSVHGNNSAIQVHVYKKPMGDMDELKHRLVKLWADFELSLTGPLSSEEK